MLNDYSNPTLANCTFSDSWTAIGGGMFNLYNSNPTITNCTFSGNSADGFGGGICNWCYSSPALTDCTFSDNSAGYDGGGMANYYESSPKLTNCTFNGNLALNCAGGMFNYHNNCPTVTNCTFVSNNAGNGSAVFFPSILKISNSILWDGGNEIWNNDGSTIIITHSDVQDGWPGLGNIDADPCFVDADANDYHLKSEGWRWDAQRKVWTWDDITSRCIDAGNPGSPLGDELLSVPDDPDNIWGQNLRIDMGAFGGTAEASIPPYDWALLSDATNDGISDLSDLDILSSLWLNTAEQLYADFNRDGVIDLFDFALLAQDWLEQTTWH
jgi:predicted outer membrane repeat protein